MRTDQALLALPVALLSACGAVGNGDVTCETRAAQDYTSVRTETSVRTLIHEADRFAVTVRIDSNLQELIQAQVEGETLVLKATDGFISSAPDAVINVWMPRVQGLHVEGSGALEALDVARANDLKLTGTGSGALTFEGAAQTLDVTLDGSGSMSAVVTTPLSDVTVRASGSGALLLEGTTPAVTIDASGSGRVDAKALVAPTGTIRADGSGSVSLTVNGAVSVTLDGSGSVDLYGTPSVSLTRNGSGSLNQH